MKAIDKTRTNLRKCAMMKKFFAALIILTPSFLFAAGELSISWDASAYSNSLSWTLPQITLNGTYQHHSVDIYRAFGSTAPVAWTLLASGVIDGTFTDYPAPADHPDRGYGTYSYELRNVVQWNYDGQWYSSNPGDFTSFGPVRSYFLSDGNNNNVVTIEDGAGGQDTFGAKWKFTYSLQETAYPDVRIYKPGTKFTRDSRGFYERPASTWVVKEIINYDGVNSAPRPQGSNCAEWDCKDSAGNLVPNGIYYVMFEIFDPFDPPEPFEIGISTRYYNFNGNGLYKKRSAYVGVIPVDILRIKDLTVTGITQTNPSSSISYNINASAELTVLILAEGANFELADSTGTISYGSGSSYVYYAGSLIPAGLGADIVRIITYYRGAGVNTETWDGTSSGGSAVSNGIYPVGVCARDGSGNTAISVSANDQPFFEYVTVDRRTTTSSVEGTPPQLVSVSPSSGTTTASFSLITVVLSDASGVNAAETTISVSSGATIYSHANGNATQSPVSGTGNTYTLTLSSAITDEGSYTVTITAEDIYGNQQVYTSNFIVAAGAGAGDDFKAVVRAYPQPAKTGSITIRYDDATSSIFGALTPVNIVLEVYTIFGEKVKTHTATPATGTFNWNYNSLGLAPGVYIYKLRASGNSKTYETVKKMVIYR